MAFNFQDYIASQQPSGGNGGFTYQSNGGGFNWQDFVQQYHQVAQANEQLYGGYTSPWYTDNNYQQNGSIFGSRDNDDAPKKYRQMTDLERFSAGARQTSDYINNYVGNWLFGTPDNPLTGEKGQQGIFGKPEAGADLSAIKPENVPRMLANIPGMFIGSIPDVAAYGSELIAGTPAQEGNLETGMIEDRRLTNAERAADIGYAGLSALSMVPGLGPEAKLAGAGFKVAGKATGKDLLTKAGNMAMRGEVKEMGALERSAYNAGKRGRDLNKARWGDTAMDAASAGVFEAFQEGGQTAAEDVRYHQFDLDDPNETRKRVAEGMFWGGLAGSLVGGTPSAINTGVRNYRANNDKGSGNDPLDGTTGTDTTPFRRTEQSEWESLQRRSTSGRYTPEMVKYYDDLAKSDSRLKAPGSVNLILKTSDASLGLHDWIIGADDYVDAWNQGDEARTGLARQMSNGRVPVADAVTIIDNAINNKIVDGQTYDTVDQALSAVNKKFNQNRGFEAALEKRPGAKYTGGYGNVVGFAPGRGFTCHPALVKQINADFDSDMGVLHLITRSEKGGRLLNLDGYFGEKILSPEGTALVDFYYTDLVDGRYKEKEFADKLHRIFAPYAKTNMLVKDFVDRMTQAVKSDNPNQSVGEIVEEIRQTVNSLKQRAVDEVENGLADGETSVIDQSYQENYPDFDPKRLPGGRQAVSNIFASSRPVDIEALKQQRKTMRSKDLSKLLFKTLRADDQIASEIKKELDSLDPSAIAYAHGTIKGSGHATDAYDYIGLALYTLEEAANQPFRQHGQMGYNSAKLQGAYKAAWEMLTGPAGLKYDVADAIIRCSFRISRVGTTPLEAIESLIDSRVVSTTERRFDLQNKKIASEEDFDQFEDYFVDAWDEGARDYTTVHNIPTINGEILDPTAPRRNEIKGTERSNQDVKLFGMFADHTMGEMFDSVPESIRDFSVGDVIKDIVESPGTFNRIFANAANPTMNNIVDRLAKAYLAEKRGVRASVERNIQDINFAGIHARKKANGDRFHASDYGALTWFVNSLVHYITPEGFHYLGITDPIDFLEKTEIGQKLIDPDSRVRFNTFYALLAHAKFGLYQDAIKGNLPGLTEEEAARAKENAIDELVSKYYPMPGINGRIAAELIANNGESNTLDIFTSFDGTFEEKEKMYKSQYGEDSGTDLVVDMLIDSNDDFSVSTVSKKSKMADQSMAAYQRSLFKESRESIENIETALANGTLGDAVFAAAMNCAALKARVDINDDTVSLAIFNALGTGISWQEKGVNESASSSFYEADVLAAMGQPIAYVEEFTAYTGGAVTANNFANNPQLFLLVMSGQDLTPVIGTKTIRVYDGHRTREVTRDWIFSEVSQTYDLAKGPTGQDWLAFLNEFPQYESYFAGLVTQPIMSNGEGSATFAKTSTLWDSVKEYNRVMSSPDEGNVDTLLEAQRDHARSIVRNAILQDGRFAGMAAQVMPGMSDPNNATLSAIESGYSRASRQLIDSILYDALNESDIQTESDIAARKLAIRTSALRSNFDRISGRIDDAVVTLDLYGDDLFSVKDDISATITENNKSAVAVAAAQDILDTYCDQHGLERISVVSIDTGTGELSDAQLKIAQLQLQAEHDLYEIQRIIEETEDIDEESDLDYGQTANNLMLGIGTVDTIDSNVIRNLVENALKQKGEAVIDPQTNQNVITDEMLSSHKASAWDRRSKQSRPTLELETKIKNAGGTTEEFMHNVPNLRFDLLPATRIKAQQINGVWSVPRGTRDVGDISPFVKRMDMIIEYLKATNAFSDYQSTTPVKFVEDNFYDEDGNLKVSEWKKFIRETNNRVIEYTLNEVNDELGTEINANAYLAAYEYFEAYDQMVSTARKALKDAPNPWGNEGDRMNMSSLADGMERPIYPTPNFDDAKTQACVTQLTGAMAGSPIPGGISRSGGYLKQANAMSWLPTDRAGFIEPTSMTVDEINDLRLTHPDINQWICVKDGDWAAGQEAYDNKGYTITTVGAMLKSGNDLSNGVLVFNPEDNPHGMWVTNTPASLTDTNRPALRFSSINGGIIDTTQEAMLLKLKKRFEQRIRMVEGKGKFGSKKPGEYRIPTTFDSAANQANEIESMRADMVEVLKQYRREFASDINELFQTDLRDTGYGYTQALIYAQGLTPGMICSVNGKSICISAETLFDPQAFNQHIAGIIEAEGQFAFESGKAFIVAPSEIHYRIEQSVDESERVARMKGEQRNNSQIRNSAYEKCTSGWNTWLDEDQQLSLDDIFSRGSALGWRHRSTLVPEEVATVYSKYLDLSWDGKSGAVAKPLVEDWFCINSKTNDSWKVAINSATKALDIKGIPDTDVKVLRVYISDAEKAASDAVSSSYNYWDQLRAIPENAHWSNFGETGVCYVTDENQLANALKWADKTGSGVIMPESFVSKVSKNRDLGGGITYDVKVQGEDGFVFVDIQKQKARRRAKAAQDSTSSVTAFNPDAIEGVCLNSQHVYQPGDATLQVDREFSQELHDARPHTQSVRALTNGVYGKITAINTEESADKLIAELYDENGTPKSNEDWSNAKVNLSADRFRDMQVSQIQADMYDFLQSVKRGSVVDPDGFKRRDAGRNKILGIINVESKNGDRAIVPVYAPNNSPKNYDSCSVTVSNDGNIYIVYSTTLNTFGRSPEEQYFKASIPDMSFKGVIALVPDNVDVPTYTLPNDRASIQGKNPTGKVRLITSWDTVKSRVPGRERQIQISDMWYFSKKHCISYLYDRDGEVKKYILDQYAVRDENGNVIGIDEARLNRLLNGRHSEWRRVARGEITLTPDEETQEIHKTIVRNNLGKVNMALLFSPGWDQRGVRTKHNVRFYLALDKTLYDQNRVLKFFNGMDQDLCPNGIDDLTDINKFMFDHDGRFHQVVKGEAYWEYVKWGAPDGIGAFSELAGTASQGKESHQAFVRLAMDKGYNGRDSQMAMDYATLQAGDPALYRDKMIKDFSKVKKNRITARRTNRYEKPIESLYYATRAEKENERAVRDCGKVFLPENRRTVYYKGKEISDPYAVKLDGIDGNPVVDAVGSLQGLFTRPLSHEVLTGLSYAETGHTYNDGKGANKIKLTDMADSFISIKQNIEDQGLVIVGKDFYDIGSGRVSMPLINLVYAEEIWNSCPAIRNHPANQVDGRPSFDKFQERMMEEQEKVDSFLHNTSGRKHLAQKLACLRMSEYCWRQYGQPGKAGIIYENWTAEDLINTTNWFSEPLINELRENGLDPERFRELNEQSAQLIADARRRVDGRRFTRESPDPNSATGKRGRQPADYSRGYHKVFRYATDTTCLMGVLDIFLTPSNVIYRVLNQGIMGRIMSLGQNVVLGKDYSLNPQIVKSAARNDVETMSFWSVLREAAFQGDQDEMFAFLQEGGTVSEYVDMKAEAEGPLQRRYLKAKNLIFKIASGGNIGVTGQIQNFFNRITFFFNEDPTLRRYWLAKDPETGLNRMETMLNRDGGGAEFLREVFTQSESNISYLAALNALESCRQADIAQRHIVIEMFKNATNRHPVPEFLARTLVSRYPRYALNFMEECINLVLPMSTLRYCFTAFMAEVGHARAAKAKETGGNYIDPHYEELLRNTNVREALIVDAMHLGAFGMLCVLAGLPGAIEPPEDEKKWGNYKEWLILNHRVGEAWWIEDILGIVVPSACFWKSVQLGKPRLDLIFNGVSDVCYNNPMIKVSDAVAFMLDPMTEIDTDYQAMLEKYGSSPDGGPGFMDYLQAKGTSFGLSYASQFFTPTFVKTIANWATPYELDYKNVYKENVRGTLTEGGTAGEELTRTTYEDAMIRRLTRKNPALALIMDLTHPGTTSYSGLGAIAGVSGKKPMPYTRYLDQYQYAAMKQWSIVGLSDEEAQIKTMEILTTLMEYQDDLDALVATGFYLDSPTKQAVSSMIWDTYYQLDQEWNAFCKSDESDYKVLGYGDWDAGKEQFYVLKEMHDSSKREINNFYYKVMKSSQLSAPMVEYRRYNTTYAQDDDGNWYATGYHPQGLLPVVSAPGTLTDPEGTAGYENDFVTVSAVTGGPLEGMRALVPWNDGEYVDWPDLEDWSDDGNGNGYSKTYQQWYGTDGSGVSTKTPTTTPSNSTGKTSGGSGGGGGGSRGGGGRSYAPNTSSPNVSLPRANAGRIMNTDRLVKPEYQYLRPDFETKGSREAYRRSDI